MATTRRLLRPVSLRRRLRRLRVCRGAGHKLVRGAGTPGLERVARGDQSRAVGVGVLHRGADGFSRRRLRERRPAGKPRHDRSTADQQVTAVELGFFALGKYRPAAMEAHAVASLGKMPDWPMVYAIYRNVDPYTKQLRALEHFAVKPLRCGRVVSSRRPVCDRRLSGAGPGRVPRGSEGRAERHRCRQTTDHGRRHGASQDRSRQRTSKPPTIIR